MMVPVTGSVGGTGEGKKPAKPYAVKLTSIGIAWTTDALSSITIKLKGYEGATNQSNHA